MATTSTRTMPQQQPHTSHRHHPYAPPAATSVTAAGGGRKAYSTHSLSPRDENGLLPPSPPRSRRDASETPSLGLGLAFGGTGGGKWWDAELPPPPASLTSILDSFRRSGEGDRELLLSILSAKKAEEERLTAVIQTRLTVLQARLSLHSAAAAMAVSQSHSQSQLPPALSTPTPSTTLPPPRGSSPSSGGGGGHLPDVREERTPSLSASSSSPSPPAVHLQPPHPQSYHHHHSHVHAPYTPSGGERIHLPPPVGMYSSSGERLAPIHEDRLRPYSPRPITTPPSASDDPRHSAGLEMLLDAGMREAERGGKERV